MKPEKRAYYYKNAVKMRSKNKRVTVTLNDDGSYTIGFKVLDNDFSELSNYIHQAVIRNKIVYNGLRLSKEGTEALLFGIAHMLGYDVISKR